MFASLPTFRAMNVECLDYISIIALLRAAEDFGTIGVENSPIVVKEGKINVFFPSLVQLVLHTHAHGSDTSPMQLHFNCLSFQDFRLFPHLNETHSSIFNLRSPVHTSSGIGTCGSNWPQATVVFSYPEPCSPIHNVSQVPELYFEAPNTVLL